MHFIIFYSITNKQVGGDSAHVYTCIIYYSLKVCHYQSIKQKPKGFWTRACQIMGNTSKFVIFLCPRLGPIKCTLERGVLFLHFYLVSINPSHPSWPTGCFCPDANRMFFCNHNTAVRKYSTILLKASDKDPLLERCLTACNDIML